MFRDVRWEDIIYILHYLKAFSCIFNRFLLLTFREETTNACIGQATAVNRWNYKDQEVRGIKKTKGAAVHEIVYRGFVTTRAKENSWIEVRVGLGYIIYRRCQTERDPTTWKKNEGIRTCAIMSTSELIANKVFTLVFYLHSNDSLK